MPPEQDTTQTGVSADTEIQTPAETYVAGFSDGRGNERISKVERLDIERGRKIGGDA